VITRLIQQIHFNVVKLLRILAVVCVFSGMKVLTLILKKEKWRAKLHEAGKGYNYCKI